MFSALLRTQLLTTARVARPVSQRSLSALAASRALPAATRIVASRTFTQSAVAAQERARNPPSNMMYLGNLPWATTEQDLRELLAEFGTLEEVRFPTSADGRPRGFVHVTFADQAAAEAAVNSALEEPLHLNGRDLYVDFAVARRDTRAPEPMNKLYFKGFNGDEEALRQALSEYNDQIISIMFIRDNVTGKPLQSGFVEFETIPQATTVRDAFAGSELFALEYARPRRERRERFDDFNANGRQGSDRRGRDDRRSRDRYSGDSQRRGGPYQGRDWQPRD